MDDHTDDPRAPAKDDEVWDDLLRAAWGTRSAGPTDAQRPPTILDAGRYRDFKLIGRGGMGVVFRAYDAQLQRPVALKVVRPPQEEAERGEQPETPFDVTPPPDDSEKSGSYAELTHRFLQEAWLTGALEHPGVVPVYEMGATPRGVPYYTMRYVRGVRTLATALGEVQKAEERLAFLDPLLQVCDAIDYAHACGVVHRDLKPANIGLGEFGEVMVLDWGLAKMRDAEDTTQSVLRERVRELRQMTDMMTLANALGTPGYMSPEAVMGNMALVDERSDVYSLGSILYQVLTGRLPVEFQDYGELLQRQREGASLASAIEPAVSVELASICARALAFDRAKRWPSAKDLASAIRRYQRRSRERAEVRALMEQADAAYAAASAMEGDARLRQLDRVRALCDRTLARRAGHKRATLLLERCEALRLRTDEQRAEVIKAAAERTRQEALAEERARHDAERERLRRRIRRAAIGVLILIALGAGLAAGIFAEQRSEARAAEQRNWALLRDLGVTEEDRDDAQAEVQALVDAQAKKQASLERLEVTRKEAQAAADKATRDLEAMRARVVAFEAEAQRRAAESQAPPHEDPRVAALTEQLAEARQQVRITQAQVAGEKGRLEAATRALERTQAEIATLRQSLKEARARLATQPGTPDGSAVPELARVRIDNLVLADDQDATKALLEYVEEAPPLVKDYAIRALGRRGHVHDDAVDALCDLLEELEDKADRQVQVFLAIGESGNVRASRPLLKFLRRGSDLLRTADLGRAAMFAVGSLRTRESLDFLLYIQTDGYGDISGSAYAMEGLQLLTGLPFTEDATWRAWGANSRSRWKPDPFEPGNAGEAYCHHGWRFCLERPNEVDWKWSRPEEGVVRIDKVTGAWDQEWVEVRATSGLETWPREEGESNRTYETRRLKAAATAARELLPASLRTSPDTRFDRRGARLGRLPAIEHEAQSERDGAWRVLVAEKDDLVYTVVVHHGQWIIPVDLNHLEDIVKSFRSLDR